MNLTGSVKMLDLNSFKVVTREQFVILPMPVSVITRINRVAVAEGRKHNVRFAGGPDIEVDIEGAAAALPDFIIPADQDLVQPDVGALQQLQPHDEAVEGDAGVQELPMVADEDIPELIPRLIPNQDLLPLPLPLPLPMPVDRVDVDYS
jgi:hypothetical protein